MRSFLAVTLALCMAMATSCDSPPDRRTITSLGVPSTLLNEPGCDLFGEYLDARLSRKLIDSKPVPRDELKAIHQADRAWRLKVLTSPLGELHRETRRLFAAQDEVESRILAIWGADGVAITEETMAAGTLFMRRILQDPIELPGRLERIATATEYSQLSTRVMDAMGTTCLEPAKDLRAGSKGEIDPIEGHLLYQDISREPVIRWLGPTYHVGGISLSEAPGSVSSEASRRRLGEDGWSRPRVAPDSRSIAVSAMGGDRPSNLLIDRSGRVLADLTGAGFLNCPSWATDGQSLIATAYEGLVSEPEFVRVDKSGERIERFATDNDLSCPIEVDEGIVFSGVHNGRGSLWLTDHDGRNRRALLFVPGCAAVTSGRAIDGNLLPISVSCDDLYLSGLYVVDIAARSAKQLVSGAVGGATFSADGQWLSFVHSPVGAPRDELAVWVMSADGTKASQVTEDAWWPAFLPKLPDANTDK